MEEMRRWEMRDEIEMRGGEERGELGEELARTQNKMYVDVSYQLID
jgi:hypothetical protein